MVTTNVKLLALLCITLSLPSWARAHVNSALKGNAYMNLIGKAILTEGDAGLEYAEEIRRGSHDASVRLRRLQAIDRASSIKRIVSVIEAPLKAHVYDLAKDTIAGITKREDLNIFVAQVARHVDGLSDGVCKTPHVARVSDVPTMHEQEDSEAASLALLKESMLHLLHDAIKVQAGGVTDFGRLASLVSILEVSQLRSDDTRDEVVEFASLEHAKSFARLLLKNQFLHSNGHFLHKLYNVRSLIAPVVKTSAGAFYKARGQNEEEESILLGFLKVKKDEVDSYFHKALGDNETFKRTCEEFSLLCADIWGALPSQVYKQHKAYFDSRSHKK